MQQTRVKEEYAVILDFLPHGYSNDARPMHMKPPIAQAIGKSHFVLLELVPKKEIFLQPNEEVYMGEGKRDKIHHIVGRIPADKLTPTAQSSLEEFIKKRVQENEQHFIEFFNKAGPINVRSHQLELIPGLGKKHMWQILEEREKEPFKSFKDLKDRVRLMPDPEKSIIKRLLMEINGKDKFHIFVGQ